MASSARPTLETLPFRQWAIPQLEGRKSPLLIAGPCSAESREQLLAAATGIATQGDTPIFRAGIWKPRTRPGQFEGAGESALEWLKELKSATGLLVMTEVATSEHVEACLKAGIDMLWIGARTTPNPFSVQEIADALKGVDIPVFVKNPINPDLQLWIGALERLQRAGLKRLAAIHRGFSWFERTPYRNSPMWEFPIRLKAAYPGLELICDPSHIAGKREALGSIAQQALDIGFNGLMVEVHPDPPNACSDADQQIDPQQYSDLIASLIFRKAKASAPLNDRLQELRDLIDQLDEEIAQKLGTRMDIAERIGDHKREHNVAILQPERWERIMQRQLRLATELGLSREFVQEFMDAVHRESIRRQTLTNAPFASGSPANPLNGVRND